MEKSIPKFCVLLTSYNGLEFINKQIDSILNQKNILLDIFISDDFSDDGTYEYLKEKINQYKNIILLNRVKKFNIAAKNFYRLIKDVDFMNYDYIALADQDDIWHEEKLYEAYKKINQSGADCYSGSVLAFWKNKKSKILHISPKQKKYDYFFESAGPGCTFVLKKKSFQELKQFILLNWNKVNAIEVHDWMIYAFMRSNNKNWFIDKKYFVEYRQHQSNQLGANIGFKGTLKRLKILKKGWGKKHLSLFVDLFLTARNETFARYFKKGRWAFFFFIFTRFGQFRRKLKDNFLLIFIVFFDLY